MKVEDVIALTKRKKEYDFSQRIKTKYLPYLEKCSLVKGIIDRTCYEEVNGKKMFKRNTQAMIFVFTMRIIEEYTDLEFEKSDVVKVYDMLMESKVMDPLLKAIPQEEITILKEMLEMQREDEELNVHSLVTFLENRSESAKVAMDALSKVLEKPEIQSKIANLKK